MGLTIKADDQTLPAIVQWITGGNMGGDTPPPDPNEPSNYVLQSSENPPLPASPGKTEAAQPSGDYGPTKLDALQQLISGNKAAVNTPIAAPANLQSPPPPADLATSTIQGQATLKPTFIERHPTLAKFLSGGLEFAQDAAPGIGTRTFGQGAQAVEQGVQQRALTSAELAQKKAQTDLMTNTVTVRDPYGNVYQIPKGQLGKFVQTSTTEQGKNARNDANINSRESIADANHAIALRKQGLRDNGKGGTEPIPYEELTPAEQATVDLKHASEDAANARADMDRAKNDPNSPAYQAAAGRLKVAQQNAQTAAGRLGLQQQEYNANYLGIGPTGEALPGVAVDEKTGKPIGPRVANAGKASADRLKRGDLAANAIHNLDNIASIVQRRSDLFGPVSGRWTNVKDMIGSDDPDIRAVGVEIHNYALASNGAHGVRSQGAVEKTEDEILRHFRAGTQGIMGGINAAKDSLGDFVKDQQFGSRPRPSGPATSPTPPSGANKAIQQRDQKLGVVYLTPQ